MVSEQEKHKEKPTKFPAGALMGNSKSDVNQTIISRI